MNCLAGILYIAVSPTLVADVFLENFLCVRENELRKAATWDQGSCHLSSSICSFPCEIFHHYSLALPIEPELS